MWMQRIRVGHYVTVKFVERHPVKKIGYFSKVLSVHSLAVSTS